MSQETDFLTNWFGQKIRVSDFETTEGAKKALKTSNISGLSAFAPQAIETGLNLFGAKKAEVVGGTQSAIMQGMDLTANALMKYGGLPGAIAGAGLKGLKMLNEYGGKKSDSQKTSDINTGSYNLAVSANAGKKFTLWDTSFNKKKLKATNKLTESADINNLKAANATYQSNVAMQEATNNMGTIQNRNQINLMGGLSTKVLSAKHGAILTKGKLRSFVKQAKRKLANSEEAKEKNVIPEGALHARLNKYDGDLAENVTPKGIPVISYESGDKIVQHAEIENSEIIFTLAVSKKLEEYFEKYKNVDDKEKELLEIECGKFLTSEILENTIDNVGLLNN